MGKEAKKFSWFDPFNLFGRDESELAAVNGASDVTTELAVEMVDIPTSNGRAAKKVVRTALGKNLANKREHGSPTATAKAALPRTPTDQLRQAHPEVSEMLIEAVVDIVGDDIGRLKFESPTSILVEN